MNIPQTTKSNYVTSLYIYLFTASKTDKNCTKHAKKTSRDEKVDSMPGTVTGDAMFCSISVQVLIHVVMLSIYHI